MGILRTVKLMNNKTRGAEFEERWCNILSKWGYWAAFIPPKKDGSQPFDVIAIRHGTPFAYDCKTLKGNRFPLERIEENQKSSFRKLWKHGVSTLNVLIVIENENGIYQIPYVLLSELIEKGQKSINLSDYENYCIEQYQD